MGVARRIAELYEVKMNAVLDRAEDPREMVDYSYAQLQELLAEVHRGAAEIAAGRRRAEMQVSGLQRSADRLQEQAEQAVAAGREDLARQALARRTAILSQVADLRDQQAALRAEEAKLSAAARRLQAKIEAFRIQKETIKAAYTAARAEASIGQAFTGISDEMGDVGAAARRAEDKTAELHARASALGDLLTSGALGDDRRWRRAAPSTARRDHHARGRRGGTGPDQATAGVRCRAAGRRLRRGRPRRGRGAGPKEARWRIVRSGKLMTAEVVTVALT